MPNFESFDRRVEGQEQAKMETTRPKPTAETRVEKKETPTTVLGKLTERWKGVKDNRETAYSGDESTLENELVAAGAMSKPEKQKLDEEMEKGMSHMLGKTSFRNIFDFLVRGEWRIASDARGKMYDVRNMTELVGEGNMSREEYEEWLKLYGRDSEAGKKQMNEKLKAKCDELSALAETPEFQSFITSLGSDYKKVFEGYFEKSFADYQNGNYEQALRGLRSMLDSHSPFVSYGAMPLNRMLKMKKLGLIGDAEMNRVFGKAERNSNQYDNTQKRLSERLSTFNLMEKMRGMGQLSDEESNKLVEEAKAEQL